MEASGIALDQTKREQSARVALLFRPDGTVSEHKGDAKGNKISLALAQSLVGGYVERVKADKGIVLADEDGFGKGLPVNTLPFNTRAGCQFVGPVLYIPRGMGW